MSKKRKKRKRLRIKNVLIFLLVLLGIAGILYLMTFIKVRTYYIYNNKYLTDEEVLKELKLNNKSSFLLTNKALEKIYIKKSKFIKDVNFHRTIDLELKIDVSEYKLLFFDKNTNKTIIENGTSIDYLDTSIPVLINKIDNDDVYKNFVKKMNKIDDNTKEMISEITYSPNGIDKERFLLSMNDGNYVYVTLTKLSKINEYKSIINSVENKKGILYLDYGNYFVPKE
ncbi:MAG: FtsQ-type POTRA domain-containing protein [Bacilli bacterium]|nr:FtsQ-type POTRA domain-containing protein [Bacilli bacterium]